MNEQEERMLQEAYAEFYKEAHDPRRTFAYCDGGYEGIIAMLGTTVIDVTDNDYQGDTRLLLEKDGKYGVTTFGWGSCSGCDALQACCTWDDLQELYVELRDRVKWFDTAGEALGYFNTHDWEGDYGYGSEEQQQYIAECKEYLEARSAETTHRT